MAFEQFAGRHVALITGRLAEPALQRIVASLKESQEITLSINVMPITVAALMSPEWIGKQIPHKVVLPDDCDFVLLPGYCTGSAEQIAALANRLDKPVFIGPKDLRRLPEFFGGQLQPVELTDYSIEIIAEINHAPQIPIDELINRALHLQNDGADVIDIGCNPGEVWSEVGVAVKEIASRGLRVSIDSLNPKEIAPAVENGASLVLSVNSSNLHAAVDWGCEVVAIPDNPEEWQQVSETIEFLDARNVPIRIDPIIEPVGFGFARSLSRYMEARKIWPDTPMMMGIGNLTELSDVDSAGVNFLLLAICEELAIGSVLTTQVINWASSSVKECDIARRMVHLAVRDKLPPKNMSDQLVCLRDAKITEKPFQDIQDLASQIKDNNYRILSDQNMIHLLSAGQHLSDADAFNLFHKLMESKPDNIDASHAFYLGFEMCKATIANQLGKNYSQDESLDWGHLTVEEPTHRRLKKNARKKQ